MKETLQRKAMMALPSSPCDTTPRRHTLCDISDQIRFFERIFTRESKIEGRIEV